MPQVEPIHPTSSPASKDGGSKRVLKIAGMAAAYVLTARLGLMFTMGNGGVTAIWPPTGIALAGLLLLGNQVWPGVWIGSFVTNIYISAFWRNDAGGVWSAVWPAAVFATGSLLAAVIGAGLLRRFARGQMLLASVKGVFLLLVVGGVFGCLIRSAIGCSTLCSAGYVPWSKFSDIWLTWWFGDAVGVFVFTPLFLAWGQKQRLSPSAGRFEIVACFTLLVLTSWYVFGADTLSFFGGRPHPFICLPTLAWVSLRLGSRGATAGLLILSVFAVWGTTHGLGPFGAGTAPNNSLLILDSYLTANVSIGLSLVAATWMRRRAEAALLESNRTLETRVDERAKKLQKAADHLGESQERLKLAIEASNIGYWEWDIQTNEVHYSPEWKAQLGHAGNELQNTTAVWSERLHPQDKDRTLAVLDDYLAGRVPVYEIEFRLRHKDGSYRWIHCKGSLQKDEAGKPRRMLGCHVDITARKRVEFEVAAFATLGRKLNEAADVRVAGRLIVEVADSLIGWDSCALILQNPTTGLCRSVLNIDVMDGQKKDCSSAYEDKEPSLRMRKTMEQGAELIFRNDPGLFLPDLFPFGDESRPSASLMFVPVRDGRKSVGMLTIQSYRLNAYTQADLDTLQSLADYCGGALSRILNIEALDESQRRLQLALDIARMGTWDLIPETNTVQADSILTQMFAGPGDMGPKAMRDFREHIHPEDIPVLQKAVRVAVQGTDRFHAIFRVVWRDGTVRWLEGRGNVFRDAAGNALRMVGVTMDITERKSAEEAIRRSEKQYSALINTVDGIVWEADARTFGMIFISHQVERILGYPIGDWINGKTFWKDRIYPEDREKVLKYRESKAIRGEDHSMEYRMIAADGRAVWVEDFVTVVKEQGKPAMLRGVMVDITRRKNLELEQARSFSLLQATIESSTSGLLVVDNTGRVVLHNRRFAELWRIPQALLESEDDEAMLSFVLDQIKDPERFVARVHKLYTEPDQESFDTIEFKDGRIFERFSRPQRLDDQVTGRVWSFHDVTERKQDDLLIHGQSRVLALIASGLPLHKTLRELCLVAESCLPGMSCSILLLDEDGIHLRHGAAPSLSDRFTQAIDGVAIGPCVGSCGTAAYRKEAVFVDNIATDPLWSDFKQLALSEGLRACWSMPVMDSSHRVLGTLALYYRETASPAERETDLLESVTNTAAIAIIKALADRELSHSNLQLGKLSSRVITLQEAERRHLARELHDEIGQTLTAAKLNLQHLIDETDPQKLEKRQADTLGLIDGLLQSVRTLSLNLRPPILDDLGLVPALRWMLDQHSRATNQPVDFEQDLGDERLLADIETACFRMAQEALTNIARYANAKKVSVRLIRRKDGVLIEIKDDGTGFDLAQARRRVASGDSLGLLSMHDRAALVGGRVDITSSPGAGTEIHGWFPLTSPAIKADDGTS